MKRQGEEEMTEYEILNKINSPDDLKALQETEIKPLAAEIRKYIIEKVEEHGGHLASNLGVVELTLAIHKNFNSPTDRVIFDVGHQSYVHKMLTGRRERFDTLRECGGLSGFTRRDESEHDPFGAGHSSTSISAALGFARADKLSGSDSYTVAVIGDGAFTGGMAHEAINNVDPDLNLIVILNENGMSISRNKGAFASYLRKVRISKGYIKCKEGARNFLKKIPLGNAMANLLSYTKRLITSVIYKTNYFEELGFYYIGTIDGNDYEAVSRALREAKRLKKSVLIHVKTKKGEGYPLAEKHPDKFHSIKSAASAPKKTYHSVFSEYIVRAASFDDKVVAVTPAMGIGTGLTDFEETYPKRYFDVGIAEGHALTFSAGLAAAGYKPYIAIYSTFLQRAYDSVLHDVALQSLPVRMIIDRAGLALGDGATHHGIFDVAFLSHIPRLMVLAPSSFGVLRAMLSDTENVTSPVAIRYPNASESSLVKGRFYPSDDFSNYGVRCDFDIQNPPRNILVTYGAIAENVIIAEDTLKNSGYDFGTVLVEKIKPYDNAVNLLKTLCPSVQSVIYVEEGIKNGGAAMITEAMLNECGMLKEVKYGIVAIDDNFVDPSEPADIYDFAGLSVEKIVKKAAIYASGT